MPKLLTACAVAFAVGIGCKSKPMSGKVDDIVVETDASWNVRAPMPSSYFPKDALWRREVRADGLVMAVDTAGRLRLGTRFFQRGELFGTRHTSPEGAALLVSLAPDGKPGAAQRFDAGAVSLDAIAAADDGGVIVAGAFRRRLDLHGKILEASDDWNPVIARLDAKGRHVWSHRRPRLDDFVEFALIASGDGGAFIAGNLQESDSDVARRVVALNARGERAQDLRLNGNLKGPVRLTRDGAGGAFVVASHVGALRIGPRAVAGQGSHEQLSVARVNSAGKILWLLRAELETEMEPIGAERVVNVDTAGNLVLALPVAEKRAFADKQSDPQQALFVTKIAPTGTPLWHATLPQKGTPSIAGVAATSNGDTFVFGDFADSLRLGEVALTSAGGRDLFLAALGPSGALRSVRRFGDTTPQQKARLIAAVPDGVIVVAEQPFPACETSENDFLFGKLRL
jgi:hypothetical protein